MVIKLSMMFMMFLASIVGVDHAYSTDCSVLSTYHKISRCYGGR